MVSANIVLKSSKELYITFTLITFDVMYVTLEILNF